MKKINIILIAGLCSLLVLFACNDDWDKHYNIVPDTVDANVWDAIKQNPEISDYVSYIKKLKFDTLFNTDIAYTLFIPTNAAFESFTDTTINASVLDYHISAHFIQSVNVYGKRKIQTLAEKFALFERNQDGSFFDAIPLEFESPLYRNGKYFILGQVGVPKPNLYEYIADNNPILKSYIDAQDSIILDREKSKPVGFDDDGNTIYDTVSVIFNKFEAKFFPVSKEQRYNTATLVFPKEDEYNAALDVMAESLGGLYTDYNDIPISWQHKILIPYLLEFGVFENMMEEHEFIPLDQDTFKLKNILGDSIIIDYMPREKTICSNGYAYNYTTFSIPDTLFTGSVRIEGESLIKQTGANSYSWRDEVEVKSDLPFIPSRQFINTASEDSILVVNIVPKTYTGEYSVEFQAVNLFPRKYIMSVNTKMYNGGKYEIYLNDELVKTFDYREYTLMQGLIRSVTGVWLIPDAAKFNKFDGFVEYTGDYGDARIRFEYKGPSVSSLITPGLVLDYIEFIPYSE
jgi:hypothetical protein